MSSLFEWPQFRALGRPARAALEAKLVAREFSEGALLLRAGERATDVSFVLSGLVREFYVSAEGDEQTRAFVTERGVTGSLLDLRSGVPAVTFIEALEPTRTVALSIDDFDALAAAHVEVLRLAWRHAEALALQKTRREHAMLALEAPERLARWREEQPGLEVRVSRRLVASYLGITPQHLSRISGARRGSASRRR